MAARQTSSDARPNTAKRKKGGRPKKTFSQTERRQIQRYVAKGLTTGEVARLMRTTPDVLRREARDLLPTRQGRPATTLEPSLEMREWVAALRGLGLSEDDLSTALRISTPELRLVFEEELRSGEPMMNANVAGALYKAATEGDVRAMVFWLSCRAGWKPAHAQGGGSWRPDAPPEHVDTNQAVRSLVEQLGPEARQGLRQAMQEMAQAAQKMLPERSGEGTAQDPEVLPPAP